MRPRIDLNADVGESFGAWVLGDDERLLASVTSASIACGGHAGDPGVMRRTVRLARAAGVGIGAHPGFPDLAGFGRRHMAMTPEEIEDHVLAQIGALAAVAAAEGVRLRHVKPHGALYTAAAHDGEVAGAIVRAVSAIDASLAILAPPRSALLRLAAAAGLPAVAEGFADRAYEADGSLTPRGHDGATVGDADAAAGQAVGLANGGTVVTRSGTTLDWRVESICVHGDTPGAASLARAVRDALEAAGVEVAPFRDRLP